MTRLIDARTVERYLSPDMALGAMERCFSLEAAGMSGPVERADLSHPDGWMRVLPAVFEGLGVFGHKVISFNRSVGVRYVVSLFDIVTGDLRAIVDAESITGHRTGATAAVAASRLCPDPVEIGAVIGTGSVARSQLPALQLVRPVEEIRVYSRRPDHRRAFIDEMQPLVDAHLVEARSVDEAVDGAGIVTLATKSTVPVLRERHLAPGIHVSSVGSARPSLFEVEPAAFAAFEMVVCDSVDLVFTESGDAMAAVSERLYERDRAVDLASIVGESPSLDTRSPTLFKSTGTGLQDLALSMAVVDAVEADGAGIEVDRLLSLKEFGPTGRT